MQVEVAKKPNKRVISQAANRAKIVAAAEQLFRSVGYEAATIRAIAKQVGMSTGAVFSNFNDKAELYSEIHGHAPITPEQGAELLAVLRGEIARPRWLLAMQAEVAA